jgi:DNA-directed RNA polymerase beta subunit
MASYGRLNKFSDQQAKIRNADGGLDCLIRQPAKTAGHHGAPRLGELCMATLQNHGASATILDKAFYSSDQVEHYVCDQCQSLARGNTHDDDSSRPSSGVSGTGLDIDRVPVPVGPGYCDQCQTSLFTKLVTLPFSTVHVLQHLQAMGITPQMTTGAVAPTTVGRPPDTLPQQSWDR